MWLTRLALRNPVLILMMSLMVMALGAVAVDRLAVDLFPSIDIPVVRVATFYTGAGPDDIEKSITQPIEPGVASATVSGGKQREIQVRVDRDLLRARQLGILDVVNAVRASNLLLPSGDLRAGNLDYNVFTNTQVASAKPLEDVVVRPGAMG